MTRQQRIAIIAGIALGAIATVGVVLWFGGPSEATVRRTVVTTIQEEAPASFLVTGQLSLETTVQIDSTAAFTPAWVTSMVQASQPQLLTMMQGTASIRLRVPGTVSYGFDVRDVKPEMIEVASDGTVRVQLPELSVHSVEPDLSKLQVRTSATGWMRLFESEVSQDVRESALSKVVDTFRAQARARLNDATQPRVNTARALQSMLTPPLQAAGVNDPTFQFQIGPELVMNPE